MNNVIVGTTDTSFHPPLAKIYFATVRGLSQSPPTAHSKCSERLWLYARAILVTLENYSGWLGESNGSNSELA